MLGVGINHKPEFYYEVLYALRNPPQSVFFPESQTPMGWEESWNIAAWIASHTYYCTMGMEISGTEPCMRCGEGPTSLVSARTCYVYKDGVERNPNHDWILCKECAEDHHEHWDEMWADYYAGLL